MIEDSGDDSGTRDGDGDGWGTPVDCDDDDATIHPDAPEACVNHRDDDCDGVVDHCDLELDPNVARRFVDPDADLDGELGFGESMGFVEKGGYVTLWLSPFDLAPAKVFRAASVDGWPVAEISGFDGAPGFSFGMIETDGDFDADGERDLVIGEVIEGERFVAHLFYEPVIGASTVDDANATIVEYGSWSGSGVGSAPGVTWPSVYAVGDMTADGTDDLLFSGMTNSWLVAGPITGTVEPTKGGPSVALEVAEVWAASSGDFDADGTSDLATSNPMDSTAGSAAGAVYVYLAPSSSVLAPAMADRAWYGTYGKYGPTGEGAGRQVDVGDFDGDGRDDLAVRSAGTSSEFATGIDYVVDQDAADMGALVDLARASINGKVADHIGITTGSLGDFDEDGRSDVVVSSLGNYPKSGVGYVAILLGPFDGYLSADDDANLVLRGSEGGLTGVNVAVGDLNGGAELGLAIARLIPNDADGLVGVVDLVTPSLLFGL